MTLANNPTWLDIYVPRPGASALAHVKKGSGIVGYADVGYTRPGRTRVYYEGNLYDAVNLRTWKERVQTAADRCRANYPTIAQAWVQPSDLVHIGGIDAAGHIDLKDLEDYDNPLDIIAVDEWLKGQEP